MQTASDSKLLDFGVHLARREPSSGGALGAANGPGREFINVEELINTQINEGCHGLDAFASS